MSLKIILGLLIMVVILALSYAFINYFSLKKVKEGNEDNDTIKALVKVLKSDDIKKFIDEKYDGAVIAFE